ncbi:hypothetical protein Tco_1293853 [Tanacetum coccineum]
MNLLCDPLLDRLRDERIEVTAMQAKPSVRRTVAMIPRSRYLRIRSWNSSRLNPRSTVFFSAKNMKAMRTTTSSTTAFNSIDAAKPAPTPVANM